MLTLRKAPARAFLSLRRPGAVLSLLFIVLLQLPAHAAREAIASAHPLATEAGLRILAQGGNAFDAAVAVAAALAVVEPYSSGLGSGGFFLLHRASDGFDVMVDARETAPGRARPDLYIDGNGKADQKASLDGMKAAAIPGTPAGLAWLAQRYGRLPLTVSLAPAVRLARDGFPTDARYAFVAGMREAMLKANPQSARVFLDHGSAPAPGFIVRQPELARTLEAIATGGRDAFYLGDLARRMVAAVQSGGGIWELEDLQHYTILERVPNRFTYHGARITTASLPSSGGLTLAQSLQILERFPLGSLDPVERTHFVVEALRRGYQDRERYLGDPDFAPAPEWLGTPAYADRRAASIDPDRATPSEQLTTVQREGDNTTHFSVVDANGNRVAATLSLNLFFGAGVFAGDTGVLLNNQMNDFPIAPNTPNAFNLSGGKANQIDAGKRPLSSMTPTFVENDRGLLVFGTPGGSRIISMVLLGIVDYVDGTPLDIERLVSAPRYHHQYLPDGIEYEPGAFSKEWVDALQAKGHKMQEGRRRWGNMQAVFVEHATGEAKAYSDPRGKGGALF